MLWLLGPGLRVPVPDPLGPLTLLIGLQLAARLAQELAPFDTTPDLIRPALSHSLNTSVNSPDSASWWRQMNRATVTWSGARLPVITRNATFSRQ